MADVFISYRSLRQPAVRHLKRVLEAYGYGVWFDYGLLSGEEFAPVIERELRAAKAAIVVWCRHSKDSHWVKEEADLALELKTYLPVLLDKIDLPLGFRRIDTVDLTTWNGDPRSHDLDRLLDQIGKKVGRDAIAPMRALTDLQQNWSDTGKIAWAAMPLDEKLAAQIEAKRKAAAGLRSSTGPWSPSPPPAPAPAPPPPPPPAPPPPVNPDPLPWLRRYAPWAGGAALILLLIWAPWRNDGASSGPGAPAPVTTPTPAPAATTTEVPPPSAAKTQFLDARSTPSTTRAPVILVDPASLPDFALFRECAACPEMVVLPAGSFRMGSPDGLNGEAGRDTDEGPQQNISLRRFAIARFETTWEEWEACVAAGACAQGPVDKAGGDNGYGRNRRPVIEVDWNDARAFAGHVSAAAGKGGYRRPTEAEWEYAARGGTIFRWSFGDAEGQLGTYAWYGGNSGSKTQVVGGKVANPFGLYDMHGNVWEWVEDCYRGNLNAQPVNGAAYTTTGCSSRVFRGGSWDNGPQFLRSAYRYRSTPTDRSYVLGFRLARTL